MPVRENLLTKQAPMEYRVFLQKMCIRDSYSTNPEKLSREYLDLIERGERKERVVCDYISGMTDQYSIHKFEEIYVPKAWAVY